MKKQSLIVFMGSLLVCASTTFPVQAAGVTEPVTNASAATHLQKVTLKIDAVNRTYHVFVPPQAKRLNKKLPVVIMLHGGGGSGINAELMTGWTNKALREGFIAVYPDGSGQIGDALKTWNAVHCCSYAMKYKVDDVTFISKVIDDVISRYPADAARVYVTGLSNGGMMAHRVGRELSNKVAAIAPVISGLFGDEPAPKAAVPVLTINGQLDEAVKWQGGQGGGRAPRAWDGTPLKPGLYQGSYWAATNGCATQAQQVTDQTVATFRYTCPKGREVVQYLVYDGGHAWPGGRKGTPQADAPSNAMNATDVIWDFFKGYSR